ncbi:hypothetical protein [Tessaracoccus sp. OH4464_COT-324]|uniref:hypothetical protein n=1 Tax=Tessaracoccus sp. OH4464_COT-324 TaxID=2491059 RepID=UPI000F644522|nr:hypothetical protein [Tessaracoccus sp. OH4464_COT-324]RRD45303.1 hypothetical protein EII42_11150 [Tessaracoccus sp. OH4464_COT-324]
MSEESWFFDDPGVSDDEELLRRIPWVPSHVGFDAQTRERIIHPAALRRGDSGEGMSVHMLSVLTEHGRAADTVYDVKVFGTIAFLAGVPRAVGGGVVAVPASEDVEKDAVLRAAHAEVRPSTFTKNKREWSLIRDTIVRACRWVVAPEQIPEPRGKADR